jgi:hypothetical protein
MIVAQRQSQLANGSGLSSRLSRYRRDHVAVLDIGRRDREVDQEALRIDADVALLAFDLLAGVVAARIDRSPPFSAPLTLWLSTMPRLAVAFRPASSRAFA